MDQKISPRASESGTGNAAGFKAAFGTFEAEVVMGGWQQQETKLSNT